MIQKMQMPTVKIGTRGSRLALWQAEYVKQSLEDIFKDINFEIVIIKTTGDRITDNTLFALKDKGFFIKEIEDALLNKEIDIAVHSMKDLPTQIHEGLKIGAITKRELPNDVLISPNNIKLKELPNNAQIGTSSLRRKSQLLAYRKDLIVNELRGNVDTRIKKMNENNLDGIVLAYAGVKRLGYENLISEIIPLDILLPPVGQGTLGLEVRINDDHVYRITQQLNDKPTELAVIAERSFLSSIQGGCRVPIGAHASFLNNELIMEAVVYNLDGTEKIDGKITGSPNDAFEIGAKLCRDILDQGGDTILAEFRRIEAAKNE